MTITANNGGELTGFGEAAFETAVPEPTSLIFLAMTALCLVGYGWRCQRQAA